MLNFIQTIRTQCKVEQYKSSQTSGMSWRGFTPGKLPVFRRFLRDLPEVGTYGDLEVEVYEDQRGRRVGYMLSPDFPVRPLGEIGPIHEIKIAESRGEAVGEFEFRRVFGKRGSGLVLNKHQRVWLDDKATRGGVIHLAIPEAEQPEFLDVAYGLYFEERDGRLLARCRSFTGKQLLVHPDRGFTPKLKEKVLYLVRQFAGEDIAFAIGLAPEGLKHGQRLDQAAAETPSEAVEAKAKRERKPRQERRVLAEVIYTIAWQQDGAERPYAYVEYEGDLRRVHPSTKLGQVQLGVETEYLVRFTDIDEHGLAVKMIDQTADAAASPAQPESRPETAEDDAETSDEGPSLEELLALAQPTVDALPEAPPADTANERPATPAPAIAAEPTNEVGAAPAEQTPSGLERFNKRYGNFAALAGKKTDLEALRSELPPGPDSTGS